MTDVNEQLDYQNKPRRRLTPLILILLASLTAVVAGIVRYQQAKDDARNGTIQFVVTQTGELKVDETIIEPLEIIEPIEVRTLDPTTGQYSLTTMPAIMPPK